MSEPDATLLLNCPACGSRMKAPRSSIGGVVGCPSCGGDVPVRDTAAFVPTAGFEDPRRKLGQTQARNAPYPGAAAVPSTVADTSFRDRLHRTTEDAFKVDPDNPVMKRRDLRRQKHHAASTGWEQDAEALAAAESAAAPPPSRKNRRRPLLPVLQPYLVGGGALLVVVLTVIFVKRVNANRADPSVIAAPVQTPLERQLVADFRDEVWDTTVKFCNAPDIGSLLKVVRDPERVAPLMRRFYSGSNPRKPLLLQEKPDLSAIEVHRSFVVFQLPMADFSMQPIALEQTPEGFRVDWESFVAYGDLPWEELRRTRPREPVVVRVILQPSDYFNKDFPSATAHRSFKLSDQSGDNIIYGYVAAGSPVELQIRKVLLNAPRVHTVLKIRYPENSTNSGQVEITEVLEKGWIFRDDDLPDLPMDASPSLLPGSSGTLNTDPGGSSPLLPPPGK